MQHLCDRQLNDRNAPLLARALLKLGDRACIGAALCVTLSLALALGLLRLRLVEIGVTEEAFVAILASACFVDQLARCDRQRIVMLVGATVTELASLGGSEVAAWQRG